MNLQQTIGLHFTGNANSGCNPAAAEANGTKCGRPSSGSGFKTMSLEEVKKQPLDPTWNTSNRWKDRSYGTVVVNKAGQFLLRSPRGFFDGYHWTFAKGKMDNEAEHPVDVAFRELEEETGFKGEVIKPIKGTYYSGMSTSNNFYLVKPTSRDATKMDKETFALRFVDYEDAKALIMQTRNLGGRIRDLKILHEAHKTLNSVRTIKANRKLHDRYKFRGLDISVENKAGSTRSGVARDGTKWSVKMTHDYGYIRRTEANDGDHVDCFVGPNEDAENVYVIHIKHPDKGGYDEDKVFLGFNSRAEARKIFDDNYDDPKKFFMGMVEMSLDDFKEYIFDKENHGSKIVAESLK